MNYFKIFGAILILLCSTTLAIILCANEDKKHKRLCAYIDLLRYIKVQIDCYCATLEEIMRRCDGGLLAECGCTVPVSDFSSLLRESDMCLDEKAVQLLYNFENEIGKGYKSSQIAVCDYYVNELCQLRDKSAAKLPSSKKVCAAVCICVGIMIIIILV